MFHAVVVVHDPRVCCDLEARSYFQGLGHSALIPEVSVLTINPYCHIGFGYSIYSIVIHDPKN